MRRAKTLCTAAAALALLALTGCEASPVPSQYGTQLGTPLDPAVDPAFTVSTTTMDAARNCVTYNASSTWEPLLLVESGLGDSTGWRTALATAGRLTGAGVVCTLTIPGGQDTPVASDQVDFSRSSQYVARAISQINATTGKQVGVLAHSRGGFDTRWALRWWPSIRAKVDDVILLGVPNHGSKDNMYLNAAGGAAWPIFQQSRADSLFEMALNSLDETPGAGSFTNIASTNDRDSVGDGIRDSRTTAWAIEGATNLLIQDSCNQIITRPAVRDSSWVWAATVDAITHTGPAVASRFNPTAPCAAGNVADPAGTNYEAAITTDSEPPLPDYVPMIPEETPVQGTMTLPASDPGDGTRVLTEPLALRQAALKCTSGTETRFAAEPVLLVAGGIGDGSSLFASLKNRFSTTKTGPYQYPVCWVQLPPVSNPPTVNDPATDLAKGAQYVVQSLRDLYASPANSPQKPIDVITHSRGGFDTRWALKWWPDVRAMVDDAVYIANPILGSGDQRFGSCPATFDPSNLACFNFGEQSRSDSKFLHALQTGDPTPGSVSYTTIGSWNDGATVNRTRLDQRQYSWRLAGASNIVVQQYCPEATLDHATLLTDDWTWTAIADALGHTGPADPSRFVPITNCHATYTTYTQETPVTATPTTNTEPALPPYVWAAP